MNAPIRLGIAIGLLLEITGGSMAQVTQEAYVGNSQGGYSTVSVIGTTRQIVISAADALTKDGPGTLILTGTNTYSGGTNINGGTLVINSYRNLGTGPVRYTAASSRCKAQSNEEAIVSRSLRTPAVS